ncbi:MAG: hypothetical protein GX538_01470 [Gammaproteobacteria bacterium]|nr:hypothetical protein [Gammaproteobacteria bacterium]
MGIERSQLSDSVDQARKPGSDSSRAQREPPPREAVDRFRQAMQSRHEAREEFAGGRAAGAGVLSGEERAQAQAEVNRAATDDAVQAGRQPGDDLETMRARDPAEVLAMMQAQSALRDGAHMAQQAPATAAANPAAFAELVERHVRQLAVGGNAVDDRDGQVLLRMSDATLPGTDLMLSRTADGWLLRADVRSRDSYDAIREAAPELAKRFSERNLGTLEIDPQFHG